MEMEWIILVMSSKNTKSKIRDQNLKHIVQDVENFIV